MSKRTAHKLFSSGDALTTVQVLLIIIIIAGGVGGAAYYLTLSKPAASPSPTPTATPSPSPSPKPSPSPSPSPAPSPSPTPTPTPTSTPTSTPMPTPSGELFEVESLKDLLDLAFEMSYRWSDSNGTTADVSYQVAGEEEVEDVICWIMEVSINTEEESVFTVWVSQSDGAAKKVKMEDMEFTGQMAEQLWTGFGILVMFPFVTGEAWHLWEIPQITDPAYGTLQHVGSQMRTYGETQLTDNEYRFTPGVEWYDTELDHIDYRLSSIDSYMILTYFRYTLENGDWGSFELLTIKLH